MRTIWGRARPRRVTLCVAALAVGIALAGCNQGSGAALQKVSEGKLAPPGSELISESAHDGDSGEAIALRLYSAHDLTMDSVALFYDQELQAAGWRKKEPSLRNDQLSWSNDKHVIILNLMTTQFRVAVRGNCCER